MIQVDDIRKSYGGTLAVDGISFTAPGGCITGLLGPNGAGKTTTLRMIGGLLRPDAGEIRIGGHDRVRETAEARRALGVLPETHALYARLTARECIAYFGRLRGMPSPALDRRVDEMVKALDLGAIASRRTEGFSQGERARVALACALVHDPRNLILDEPTRGLDVLSVRAFRGLLGRLRDEGRAILLSSHVMQEVSLLCDRVVVIARGKVVADAAPQDLQRETGGGALEDAFLHLVGFAEA